MTSRDNVFFAEAEQPRLGFVLTGVMVALSLEAVGVVAILVGKWLYRFF